MITFGGADEAVAGGHHAHQTHRGVQRRGPRVVNKATKKEMKKILKEIQTGKFTRQWVNEYKGGLKKYNALLKKGEKHQIEKTGAYLRSMMPWMTKKNIKGVQASYS